MGLNSCKWTWIPIKDRFACIWGRWYMDEYHDRFDVNKGRSVTAVCSPAIVEGRKILVAAELANADGRQRMRLRHPDGTPAWVGGEHAK